MYRLAFKVRNSELTTDSKMQAAAWTPAAPWAVLTRHCGPEYVTCDTSYVHLQGYALGTLGMGIEGRHFVGPFSTLAALGKHGQFNVPRSQRPSNLFLTCLPPTYV